MASDNVKGADNQQERSDILSGWIVGFVDGEGCFSVSIIRNSTMTSGWQVFPEFVVTQGAKSRSALELIQHQFGCGRIYSNRRNDNHRESLLRYCVRSQQELRERVIPFFKCYPLQTAKRQDFEKFVLILQRMERGAHKTPKGRRQIASIIQTMNRNTKSRYLESSETTRRTPSQRRVKI